MNKLFVFITAVVLALCGCRQGAGETTVERNVDSCDAITDTVVAVEADTMVADSVAVESVETDEKWTELVICDDSHHSYYEMLRQNNEQLEKKIHELRERLIQRGITEPLPEIPEDNCGKKGRRRDEDCLLARQDSLKAVLAELEAIRAAAKKKPAGVSAVPADSTAVNE